MNKVKEHLAELRNYLQRDTHGTKLLDVVARDVNEQRKQIAELQALAGASERQMRTRKQEQQRAEENIASLRQVLEAEAAQRRTSEMQQTRLLGRIAELEAASAVDEEVPVSRGSGKLNPTICHVARLSKEVRKRFKTIPEPLGDKRCIKLESVITEFSGQEFMSLGMLVALLALFNMPASVEAETTVRDMDGWIDQHGARFLHWCRSWIRTSHTEQKIFGPLVGSQVCETNVFTPHK